jgi:autotransporter-associated beta strand protein
MKHTTPLPSSVRTALQSRLAIAVACFGCLTAQAANTWDGGGTNNSWTTPENWDDDAVPTFGNTSDLTFTAAGAILTNSSIANDTTIRSLTYNATAPGISIRTRAEGTNIAAGRTLTFDAPSGNASINIALHPSAKHQLRGFGVTNDTVMFGSGGFIQLNTSLDVIHNGNPLTVNTFTMGQNNDGINANSETVIQGPGGVNKSGPGDMTLSGPNTFAGGVNLTGGRLTLENNLAAGAGNITLAGTEITLLLQNNFGLNVANTLIVSDAGDKKYLRSFNNSPANTFSGNIIIQETTAGNFEVQVQSGDFTISGPITGSGGAGLRKANNGSLYLTGTNTYTGETTVNAGTLFLSGLGSIANSSRISIGNARTFNVTGLTSTFTLAPGQELSGNAAGCSLVGSVNAGTGVMRFPYNSTNLTPSFNISGGTLTMNDNSSIVFVVGSPLTNGSYQLTTGGAVAGSVAASPRVTVQGAGLVPGRMGMLSISAGDLYLVVSTIPTPVAEPLVLSSITATNFTLSWTNWQFTLQAQTNDLNIGISNNWVNTARTSPTIIPILPNNPAVFYRLFFTNYP